MSDAIEIGRLRESTLVRDLDDSECERLANRLQVAQLADGEVLVREGDDDNRLFVLAQGSLEVAGNPHGEPEVLHVMRPGECAGTRAFIDRSPRRATLRARGEATVYWLSPEDFEAMVESDPWLVYRIMCAIFRITHMNLLRMNTEARELANYVTKTHGRY